MTACTSYFRELAYETEILNIFLAALFVLDSFCYLFALIWSANSVVRMTRKTPFPLKSSIDWYLIATILYIIGSVVYQIQSVQAYLNQDSTISNLVAACIFMVDAPLYVVSVFHQRNEDSEVGFWERKNMFIIEEISGCYKDIERYNGVSDNEV